MVVAILGDQFWSFFYGKEEFGPFVAISLEPFFGPFYKPFFGEHHEHFLPFWPLSTREMGGGEFHKGAISCHIWE